jgi:hypothetical protein
VVLVNKESKKGKRLIIRFVLHISVYLLNKDRFMPGVSRLASTKGVKEANLNGARRLLSHASLTRVL